MSGSISTRRTVREAGDRGEKEYREMERAELWLEMGKRGGG